MRISDTLVLQLVATTRKLSDDQVAELRAQEKATNRPMQDIVTMSGLVSEADLVKLYARHIKMPYIDLDLLSINLELLKKIPERIARRYSSVIFSVNTDGSFNVACAEKLDEDIIKIVEKYAKKSIQVHLASQAGIERWLNQYRTLDSQIGPIVKIQKMPINKKSSDSGEELINELLKQALNLSATDIHIEPYDNHAQIRFRIDGRLQGFHPLSSGQFSALSEFLMNDLVNLSEDNRTKPKEGSFQHMHEDTKFQVDVSVLPVIDGQKIYLHMQSRTVSAPSLESLGLWGPALTRTKSILSHTNGLILVAGPGKSGKTSTLHALLSTMHSTHVSMIAIEDELPYAEPYISHVTVGKKNGMSWGKAFAASVKQGPDIILLQRLQDAQTAKYVITASEDLQLICSGLVASSAPEAIAKLRRLSIQNHDIAHVLRCIIGQRLVRSLCQNCRIKVPADETTIKRVKAIIEQFPLYSFEDIHLIEKAAASSGIGGSDSLVTTNNKIQSIWEPSPEGCDDCHETGFAGLTGIFEVMQMTTTLKESIVKSIDAKDITSRAIEEGMIPFAIDGLIKAFRGITTIDEIERAQQSAY